jgi:hypothetical protein
MWNSNCVSDISNNFALRTFGVKNSFRIRSFFRQRENTMRPKL